MKNKEIVQALRCCAKGLGHDDACENCKVGEIQNRRECIEFAAAKAIERMTAENAALKKEIRKAGRMFCARFEDRPEGFKPVSQEDCDNCTKKPDCACKKCSGIGSSTDNWEWRGLTEEHNGKENS